MGCTCTLASFRSKRHEQHSHHSSHTPHSSQHNCESRVQCLKNGPARHLARNHPGCCPYEHPLSTLRAAASSTHAPGGPRSSLSQGCYGLSCDCVRGDRHGGDRQCRAVPIWAKRCSQCPSFLSVPGAIGCVRGRYGWDSQHPRVSVNV